MSEHHGHSGCARASRKRRSFGRCGRHLSLLLVGAALACAGVGSASAESAESSQVSAVSAPDQKSKDGQSNRSARSRTRGALELYTQAWNLIKADRLDEAERMLKVAQKRVAKDFRWLIDDAFAWLSFYRKDHAAAAAAFQKILAAHDGAYMSRKGLGFIAIEQGRHDEGVTHLRQSYRQNPFQVLPSYTIPAAKLIAAKQYKHAQAILELGENVFPDSADIAFLLAKAYVGTQQVELAVKKAVAAATYAPAYIHPEFDSLGLPPQQVKEAYNAMGWGLLITGDVKSSLKRFEQYFAAGGSDPNAHRGRGFTYFRLKNYQKAIKDLEIAAREEPSRLAPITDVVPIAGTKQRWKITYNATSTLGWAYLRANDSGGAAEAFERALEHYPKWIDALTGLGYALLARGNAWAAAQKFREALQLEEGYPDAIQGLKVAGYAP